MRTPGLLCLTLLVLSLPSCVAAIGNRGGNFDSVPTSALPLLRERVDSAQRIVELRKMKVDDLRAQQAAGRIDAVTAAEAEIALEEAKIRLLEYRAEVQAVEHRERQ